MILAGLLDPSAPFAESIFYQGAVEIVDFEEHFELSDPGYVEWELGRNRKHIRASTNKKPQFTRASKPAIPCADVPQELRNPSTRFFIGPVSLRLRMFLAWYTLRHLFGAFNAPVNAAKKYLVARSSLDVWYRLLTAAMRLISSLSIEACNHEWLLKQGALQAVRKILRFLGSDRMRSGHQEAALIVYRLFENQT